MKEERENHRRLVDPGRRERRTQRLGFIALTSNGVARFLAAAASIADTQCTLEGGACWLLCLASLLLLASN